MQEVPPVVPLADAGVIESLEKALASAKAGDVGGVAIALVGRDNSNWAEFCAGQASVSALMGSIERMAFYEHAKESYCVIATGERRFYGCFIFRKGVLAPDGQ